MHGGGLPTGISHSTASPAWYLVAARFCASVVVVLLVLFGAVTQCALMPANGLATIDDWEQLRSGSTRENVRAIAAVDRQDPVGSGAQQGGEAWYATLPGVHLSLAGAPVPGRAVLEPCCDAAFSRYVARAPPLHS